MKNGLIVAAITVLMMGFSVMAEVQSSDSNLLKMKSGDCTFKLLDSNGIKPLRKLELSLVSAKDGKAVAKVVTDDQGKCALSIVDGRYLVCVNKVNLVVLETSPINKIAECRIIVPAMAMQVGGEEAQNPSDQPVAGGVVPGEGNGLGMRTLIIGGVAVVGGVAAGIVINDNDHDNRRNVVPEEENGPRPGPTSR